MLRYLILSTPRCGSSTLLRAAEVFTGRGSFLREPFNPREKPEFVPQNLRGLDMLERAEHLTAESGPYVGVKHVHSPFVTPRERQIDKAVVNLLLSNQSMRVILLSRRNLARQFISLEIALQTGNWWGDGPNALPSTLMPVSAGCERSISDREIADRMRQLEAGTAYLRGLVEAAGAAVEEVVYEDVLEGAPSVVADRLSSILGHFSKQKVSQHHLKQLRQISLAGQRFKSLARLYAELAERHPILASAMVPNLAFPREPE